jgi:hypothetical protein
MICSSNNVFDLSGNLSEIMTALALDQTSIDPALIFLLRFNLKAVSTVQL